MTDQQVPNRIGKYEILGVLGRGAMGVVYHGRDPEIGREVAIKTLRKIQAGQIQSADAALERFRMEARSAGSLRHPNIITIFEANRDNDIPYLVMDYVVGDSLDVILSRKGRLDPTAALHYLGQAAAALDHAHGRGVVHRDIKPGNILVDRLGQVFILDFGVATITRGLSGEGGASGGAGVMGSPGYMAPEQILNQRVDARSDVFSLAVMAFELLSGQRPFPGDNFTTVVGNILNGKPRRLSAVASDLPLALEAEFDRALSKDPSARFESATKFVAALRAGLGNRVAEAAPQADGETADSSAGGRRRKTTGWKSFKRSAAVDKALPERQGRKRTPTGGGSSEWREEQRPSPAKDVARPALKARTPGSIFALRNGGASETVSSSRGSKPDGLGPRLFLAGAIICIVLGLMLLAVFLPRAMGRRPEGPVISTVDIVEEILAPGQEDANPRDLSDQALSGLLIGGRARESVVLRAMREAQARQIPSLPSGLKRCMSSSSYAVRIEALRIAGELRDTELLAPMLQKLSDSDTTVREEAARAVGRAGDTSAIAALRERVRVEESPDVQAALSAALDQLGG